MCFRGDEYQQNGILQTIPDKGFRDERQNVQTWMGKIWGEKRKRFTTSPLGNRRKAFLFPVPRGGLEPPRAQGPADFESAASTNSATPASDAKYNPNPPWLKANRAPCETKCEVSGYPGILRMWAKFCPNDRRGCATVRGSSQDTSPLRAGYHQTCPAPSAQSHWSKHRGQD